MIRRPELSYEKSKRSVRIGLHKTSLSLEAAFWSALKEIAAHEGVPASTLVTRIHAEIRLYVLDHYRRLAEKAKR
jgi:predicted DNA-binding ribbon-helix-helix protein